MEEALRDEVEHKETEAQQLRRERKELDVWERMMENDFDEGIDDYEKSIRR